MGTCIRAGAIIEGWRERQVAWKMRAPGSMEDASVGQHEHANLGRRRPQVEKQPT